MKLKAASRSGNVVFEMGPGESALPPISLPTLLLKKILVPVDFSDCSRKALQYGTAFGKQFNAEVLLLHVVVSVPPPPEIMVFESEMLTAKYHEEAAKKLSEWRKEIGMQPSLKAVVRQGNSADQEIVEAARECNVDLIVLGNHGRTAFARMLIGSTAERVVRHAPCPVLVIRESEHDFVGETDPGSR